MSDFVMGAEMRMTDNFSQTMTAASRATDEFKQNATTANQAVTAFATATGSTSQATQSFTNTLQDTATAAESIRAPTEQAAQGVNIWRAAIQQFNRGTETLKSLPNTIKQIAAQRLDGLQNSLISTKLQASLLVGGIQTLARTKIDGIVSKFKEFSTTVTEGKTGLSGFVTGLKNVGKISIANTYNVMKNLTSKVKEFATTKISSLVNGFKDFKSRVTGGHTGVNGMFTALKNVAKVSLSGLHTAISKIGSLAAAAGSKVASGLGNAVKGIAKGLTAATAAAGVAIGAVMTASINVGKEFEAGMSTVSAISGATGNDLKALEEKAKQMGATTSFSATESAKAFEYMAMAGWKTDQMIGGIDGIMNLAAASGEDLATTSDIVTDALTAFGMKAEESGKFANVLAAASSNANTNVSMMGATFKYVAPVAGALGYSVEDMGVAIGLMANAGIKGEMAGTQLRATLSRMAKPTAESGEAMEKLGLSITNSDGSMKEFSDILGDMRKGFSGLTKDQQASYAAMLGGQEAMSGVLSIVNASEEDFNKLTDAVKSSSDGIGAAASMASTKLDNLSGDITILKSGLQGLGIEIYQGVQEPLRSATKMATEWVGDLSNAFKKGGFSGLVGEVGNVFAKLVTKVADYAPKVVEMAVSLVDNLLTGIEKNAPQIADGAAKAVSAFVSGVMTLVPKVLLLGVDLILKFVQGITEQLPQLIATGMASVKSLIDGIISRIPLIVQSALTLIQTLVSGLIANLPMIIQSGIQLLVSLLQGIVSMLPSLIQMALQLIMAVVQGLLANLPLIINAAVQLVVSLVQGIVSMLPMIIQAAIQLIITLFQAIIANLPVILQAAVQIIVALAVGLIQAIPQLIAAIPQLIAAIVDTIMNTNWLQVGWDIVKGIGKGLFDGIKGLFGGGGKEGGEAIAQGTASGLESNLGTVSTASQMTADTITTGLQPDYSVISGYGLDTMTGLSSGLTDNVGLATDAATSVNTQVTSTFDNIDLFGSGTSAMEGLNNGMLSMKDTLMSTARGIADGIKTQINSALDIHSPSRVMEESGEYTGEGLILGITKMIDKVRNAAQGLGDSVIEPFATRSMSNGAISPSGVSQAPPSKRDGLKIEIQNIILKDVGDKDPKALVAEILQLLYDALSGADEVLSTGEMGALL